MSLDQLPPPLILEHHGNRIPMLSVQVGLTIFFSIPFRPYLGVFRDLFEDYLKLVPQEEFKWTNLQGQGTSWKQATPKSVANLRMFLNGKKPYSRTGASWFLSCAAKDPAATSDYVFNLFGKDRPDTPTECNYTQIFFPTSVISNDNRKNFVDKVCGMLKRIPFYSAYVGYTAQKSALHVVSPYSDLIQDRLWEWAQQYRGLEMFSPHLENYELSKFLRPPSWLTFLGNVFVDKAGGIAAFKKLKGDFDFVQLDQGWAVQAGPKPVLGDNKKGGDVSAEQRSLAMVLQPFLSETPAYLFNRRTHSDTLDWMRRLLPTPRNVV